MSVQKCFDNLGHIWSLCRHFHANSHDRKKHNRIASILFACYDGIATIEYVKYFHEENARNSENKYNIPSITALHCTNCNHTNPRLACNLKGPAGNIYNFLPCRVDALSSEEVECCICMDHKSDVSLPCAHCYCKECIDSW